MAERERQAPQYDKEGIREFLKTIVEFPLPGTIRKPGVKQDYIDKALKEFQDVPRYVVNQIITEMDADHWIENRYRKE